MTGRVRLSRATVAVTIFLAVILLAISVGSLAAAQQTTNSDADTTDADHESDWPMYRYDTQDRDGHNPAANPPTEDISKDWEVDVYENEYSPIVYDGTVFVVTDIGNLQARNPDTGELIWEREVGGNPTRAVGTNGQIIVGASYYGPTRTRLKSFDPQTGHLNWDTSTIAPTFTAGPAVSNPYFVCLRGEDTYDYRFDVRDGTRDGSCDDEGGDIYGIEGTTTVDGLEYDNRGTGSLTEALAAFTTDGGFDPYQPEWEFSRGDNNGDDSHTSDAIIAGDVAFVWGDNDEHGSGVHALNRHTGEHLWHYPTPEEIIDEPIVADGNVYFTTTHRLYKLSGDTSSLPTTESTPEPTDTASQSPEPTSTAPQPTPTSTPPQESTDAPVPTSDVPPPEPTDTPTPPTESTDAPIPTPDVPPPESRTESGTPDNANEQTPEQTSESSISFPDATETPTLTPSGDLDPSSVQEAADSGVSTDDSAPETADSDSSPTTDQEPYSDEPANSRTETPPSTAYQEDVTVGTDASTADTPVANPNENDADSDASAPPADSTATPLVSQNQTQTDDSNPITTGSTQEDQTGFGPVVALLAIVGSILLAHRRA